MQKARIEVRTKDVKGVPNIGTKGDAQHLFAILVDSNAKETILRGGYDTNPLTGNIEIILDLYAKETNYRHKDWVEKADIKIQPTVIASGTDTEALLHESVLSIFISNRDVEALIEGCIFGSNH